jgi:hypothetical protein
MRDIPNLNYTSTNPFAINTRDSGKKRVKRKIVKSISPFAKKIDEENKDINKKKLSKKDYFLKSKFSPTPNLNPNHRQIQRDRCPREQVQRKSRRKFIPQGGA